MRRNLMLVIVAVAVTVLSVFIINEDALAGDLKIGYVDPARILNEYNKAKESIKNFEAKRKTKLTELKKMDDEITKLRDEQALLSEKAKAEKQSVIDEKIRLFQDFDNIARAELGREYNDIRGIIQKDVDKVITDYSKEAGYDFALNAMGVLYGKEEYDFTDEVLKRLNK